MLHVKEFRALISAIREKDAGETHIRPYCTMQRAPLLVIPNHPFRVMVRKDTGDVLVFSVPLPRWRSGNWHAGSSGLVGLGCPRSIELKGA